MAAEHLDVVRESRQDFIEDEDVDVFEGFNDEFARPRTVSERYCDDRAKAHVHVRVRLAETDSGDFCAVFERARRGVDAQSTGYGDAGAKLSVLVHRTDVGLGAVENCADEMQDSVPIYASEFVQKPEGVFANGQTVPSLVRLQALDHCLGTGFDAPDLVFPASTSELARSFAFGVPFKEPFSARSDRELRVVGGFAGDVTIGKRPRKVVQGGPHVLETITDDGAPMGGRALQDVHPEDLIHALWKGLLSSELALVGNGIRLTIAEGSPLIVERLQVLLRSR